jgi:hypothetical protein
MHDVPRALVGWGRPLQYCDALGCSCRAATRWIHYHDPVKTANLEGRERVIGMRDGYKRNLEARLAAARKASGFKVGGDDDDNADGDDDDDDSTLPPTAAEYRQWLQVYRQRRDNDTPQQSALGP